MVTSESYDEEMEVEAPGSLVNIEDGVYKCRLRNYEHVDKPDWRGGPKFLKFYLTLDLFNEDGEQIELSAYATAMRLTSRTKLFRWFTALTGQKLEPGVRARLADMLDKEALAVITNVPRDGDDGSWANVIDIIPLPKSPTKAQGNGISIGAQRDRVRELLAENFTDEGDQVEWVRDNFPKATKDGKLWLGGLTPADCERATKELAAMAGVEA